MILRALYDYYYRKCNSGDEVIAPLGYERKEISHVIVLKPSGEFVQLDDMREWEDKRLRGKLYLVPKSVKRTMGIAANLLWDNPGYVLGLEVKESLTPTPRKQAAFIEKIQQVLLCNSEEGDGTALRAVLIFLQSKDYTTLFATPAWQEIVAAKGKPPSVNLSFKIIGEVTLICRCAQVCAYVEKSMQTTENSRRCLITGELDNIERTHASIKGVWGSQSSGADIVSFNFDAAKFYNKEQGDSAPIGKKAAFAYTTALNHLLSSKQRIQIGNVSTVFWAEKTTLLEDIFGDILQGNDDPDRNTEAVKAIYRMIDHGVWTVSEESNIFYVLGLSPNAARITVRFWYVTTVKQLAIKIQDYFNDLQLVHHSGEPKYLPFWKIQNALTIRNDKKSDEKNSYLLAQLLNSILTGSALPYALLVTVIARIGAEKEVSYPRAALLKMWLNRYHRSQKFNSFNQLGEEIIMSLDERNTQLGYRLGRLFSVLEKIQEEGKGGAIRERFYRAASSTPLVIFPHLFSLKNYHLAKVENPGLQIYFEKMIGDIMNGIPADLPAILDIKDQARFAIGYYHQRQHFFTSHSTSLTQGVLA